MKPAEISGRNRSRYLPEALVATGGMGEVWRATDTVLGREVALKVLRPEYAEDPVFRERFAAEARHAASLQHPGIATVFDFGELPAEHGRAAGRPFLVMELVDGRPLSALLAGGRRLAPEVALDLVGQAAEALAVAHAAGLVHRDVKPANLLVTAAGQVKVTDFGIARAADAVALTRTDQVVGTPQYLSPEQAENRVATAASDVYALGVVLFECLTGRRPFTGDTPIGTALAHVHQPVPELPAFVPADLAVITRRALAKDPAERYADAGQLAAALRHGGEVPAAEAPTQVVTTTKGRWLPPWWPVALMGALALVLVVALVVAGRGGPQGDSGKGVAGSTTPRTQTPVKVRVRAASYLGKPAAEVRRDLRQLGLQSRLVGHRANPGGHAQGTIAALAPTGLVAKDTVVRLTVWDAPPPPAPTPTPTHHSSARPEHAKQSPGKGPGADHGNKNHSDKNHGDKNHGDKNHGGNNHDQGQRHGHGHGQAKHKGKGH